MAPLKSLPFAAIAAAAALLTVPMMGLSGGIPSTMRVVVDVRPSSSFKVQNSADLAPAGFTGMAPSAPVLVINTPPVMPEVIVEVSADVAGPVTSKPTGELTGDAGSQGGESGSKQLTLKDLGVSSPPSSRRTEGSDLKQAFERAAGEIIYRLDLLNKVNVGRQSPVIVSINL
jgi:hypothetical protein